LIRWKKNKGRKGKIPKRTQTIIGGIMDKMDESDLKKAGWKKVFDEDNNFLGWIENVPSINGFRMIFSQKNALMKLEAAKFKTASS
jgi:hypothetical protein